MSRILPKVLVAGDTLQITDVDLASYGDSGYDNTTYTLKLAMIGDQDVTNLFTFQKITANFVAGSSTYLFDLTITSAVTSLWKPGTYTVSLYVDSGTDAHTIESYETVINLRADLVDSSIETRNHDERMLDAIEAILEARVTDDVSSYSIGGRSLTKIPIPELMGWQKYYKTKINVSKGKQRIQYRM